MITEPNTGAFTRGVACLTCADCVFCREGWKRTDYNRRSGKFDVRRQLLCSLPAPSAHDGRPTTEAHLCCAFLTRPDGAQPLRAFLHDIPSGPIGGEGEEPKKGE